MERYARLIAQIHLSSIAYFNKSQLDHLLGGRLSVTPMFFETFKIVPIIKLLHLNSVYNFLCVICFIVCCMSVHFPLC